MYLHASGRYGWLLVGALLCCGGWGAAAAQSNVWKCTQANGAVTFQDRGGAGCHEIAALPELQSARSSYESGASTPAHGWQQTPSKASASLPSPSSTKPTQPALSTHPFAPAVRVIPVLSYHDLAPEWKVRGWSIPNKGEVAMIQIELEHWPAGTGPHITVDPHFKGTSPAAFQRAVQAAAKAVHYNPQFIRARLTIPVGTIFHNTLKFDGPSAGVAWAVASASALLGDTLRPEVCLTGTIGTDLGVGPVGGLEAKIDGCHLLPQFREMLIPVGQRTFTLTDKAMGYGITVREVSSLGEAYEFATGQAIRSMP